MLKGIVLTDENADVLIEKYFSPGVTHKELDPILKLIKSQKKVPPIISSFGTVFAFVTVRNVILIGITQDESSTIIACSLVEKIAEMLDLTLTTNLSVETLKIEYALAYEIIDQFIDEGLPLMDELDLIKSSRCKELGDSLNVDIRSPWKAIHEPAPKTQELKATVKEEIFTRISGQGKSDILFVRGSVDIDSKLVEPSNLSLNYSIPVKLDDYSFHRCIDPSQHLSRSLQFIPPESVFTLMTYTTTPKLTSLPIFVVPKFTWSKISVLFEISIRIDQEYLGAMNDIQIKFSLPEGVSMPSLACASGTIGYIKHESLVVWNVNSSSKKEMMSMGGSASISEDFNKDCCDISIFTKFTINGVAISGFKIDEVEPTNGLKCNKTIKYSTVSGQYIFGVD
jgi:AP-3 complex subunit mu